ncbi:MAG: hypothetical protein ABSF88_04620 [Candidatus Aminicenantales bacterium]
MKTRHVGLIGAALLTVFLVALLAAGQKNDQAELALKAAIKTETVDGDLKSAIEQYKKIANGSNHAVAAKALIRMGQCYDKLGDAEARKAYERVVREFADQKEAVEQARALLAAGGRDKQPESGVIFQQKWVLPAGGAFTEMRQPSPDGRYLPYTFLLRNRLYLHDFTTSEDRLVLESQAGSAFFGPPSISPDSRQIVYTRFTRSDSLYGGRDYELMIAGIDGSNPTTLIRDKEKFLQPRAWSPDGKSILVTTENGADGLTLSLLSIADRSLRVLTARDDYSGLYFSPDGRYIAAYRVSTKSGLLPGPLILLPTDGGKEVVLLDSRAKNWPPIWTPDGRMILFVSDRSGKNDLWAIRVSDGRPEGEPRLMRSDVGLMEPLGFTKDGTLYYKIYIPSQGDIYVADLDPATGLVTSKPERINERYIGSAGFPADWSPDGRFLAYTRRSPGEYNRSRIISIIIRSEATGEEREVFPVPASAFNQTMPFPNVLQWFPDGQSLLATDFNEKRKLVFRRFDVETGQVKVFLDLSDRDKAVYAPNLSPDGKALYYVEGGNLHRVMRRALENGEEKELYQMKEPAGSIDDLSLSKDGRQLAFVQANAESKTESLIIVPAEGGSPRELLRSKTPINQIDWTKDGRHVLMVWYMATGPSHVWSMSIEGGEPQPSPAATYLQAVHPDGRRIAFYDSKGGNEEVWVIKNLLSTPKVSR